MRKYSTEYGIIAVSFHLEIYSRMITTALITQSCGGIIDENLHNLYADVTKLLDVAGRKSESPDK